MSQTRWDEIPSDFFGRWTIFMFSVPWCEMHSVSRWSVLDVLMRYFRCPNELFLDVLISYIWMSWWVILDVLMSYFGCPDDIFFTILMRFESLLLQDPTSPLNGERSPRENGPDKGHKKELPSSPRSEGSSHASTPSSKHKDVSHPPPPHNPRPVVIVTAISKSTVTEMNIAG